jgi:polar amino acid transport system permease protein
MKLRELFLLNRNEKALPLRAALNLLLLTVIIVAVFWLSLTAVGVTFDFSFVSEYRTRIGQGFLMTLLISLASFAVSLLLGVISALEQGSRVLMLRYLCGFYVKFTRGTPLMMQIYLFFYIIGTAWGIDNRFIAGVLILSIFEGAYISEIIRGSLLSIEATQWEAAKAVGFSRSQTHVWSYCPRW